MAWKTGGGRSDLFHSPIVVFLLFLKLYLEHVVCVSRTHDTFGCMCVVCVVFTLRYLLDFAYDRVFLCLK